MKIAVVEDNKETLETICTRIGEIVDLSCQCVGFTVSGSFIERLEKKSFYDVYFLKIELPEVNGIEIAKQIRKMQKNACIIFITEYIKYAYETYEQEINAYQYILKENLYERLPVVLRQIREKFEEERSESYIIKNQHYYVNIKQSDIRYIYKEDKNSIFVTTDGVYRERKAIKEIWKELEKCGFIRIDAGRLINISFIKRIEKNILILMDGTELFLSQSNMRNVKNEISDYWGSKA